MRRLVLLGLLLTGCGATSTVTTVQTVTTARTLTTTAEGASGLDQAPSCTVASKYSDAAITYSGPGADRWCQAQLNANSRNLMLSVPAPGSIVVCSGVTTHEPAGVHYSVTDTGHADGGRQLCGEIAGERLGILPTPTP